jgi:zinc protease
MDAVVARTWLARELEAQPGVLVVVGEFDPEETAETLAEQFHDLVMATTAPSTPVPAVARASREPLRLVTRDRQQSAIAAVFPGPSRLDPARHAAEVWAAAAGGLGGRLFEALRDRRSLAYTVMASSWQRLHAGALLTYIATSPSREEEAREQMAVELERFRTDGLQPEEAERAVAYLAGQALVSRQTGADVAADMIDHWLAGAPHEEFEDPAAPYRTVTAEEVHDVARRCLDPAQRVEGMVRGGTAAPG